MEDIERYGDYNEVDEPPRKSPVLLTIKIVAFTLIFSVIGLLAFRLILFNYYPDSMKKLYFNEKLTAYYNETDGDIGALTQKIRTKYDDPDTGRFFCDNLIIIPELGQLQVSVRYNSGLLDELAAELSLTEEDLAAEDLFSFRLWRDGLSTDEGKQVVGAFSNAVKDTSLMYEYYKLVFDGVPLTAEGEDKIGWLRLEIFVKGQTDEKPYAMIPIYENNDLYSKFTEYKLSGEEVPK